jgi:hypothetical protein
LEILCLGIQAPTGVHHADVLQEEILQDGILREKEILQDGILRKVEILLDGTLHAGTLLEELLLDDVHHVETLQEEDVSTPQRGIF